jgi:hypothetical protein
MPWPSDDPHYRLSPLLSISTTKALRGRISSARGTRRPAFSAFDEAAQRGRISRGATFEGRRVEFGNDIRRPSGDACSSQCGYAALSTSLHGGAMEKFPVRYLAVWPMWHGAYCAAPRISFRLAFAIGQLPQGQAVLAAPALNGVTLLSDGHDDDVDATIECLRPLRFLRVDRILCAERLHADSIARNAFALEVVRDFVGAPAG